MKPLLIVADDLTGAADCAIAFAKHDISSAVVFNDNNVNTDVVSVDVGSRQFPAAQAAKMHVNVLEKRVRPKIMIYKKIDSLIRGQPAAETAATINFLKNNNYPSFGILAPAFPSLGRKTVDGYVRVNDLPLEENPVWIREHSYNNANLVDMLKSAGVASKCIPLAVIKQGQKAVGSAIIEAMGHGLAAVVCDATSDEDLDTIASATLPMTDKLFWIGTGGLASAIAKLEKPVVTGDPVKIPKGNGGILTVIGSLAQASRAGGKYMLASGIKHIAIRPETLFALDSSRISPLINDAVVALKAGENVLVEIAESNNPDLSKGAELACKLAKVLNEALLVANGLVITGGETAAALLSEAGVTGIRLLNEVESGVPVGVTMGALSIPIVTKSGSFGTEETLSKGLSFLHSITKKGN